MSFQTFSGSFDWLSAELKGPSIFESLPDQCQIGNKPAIISNDIQFGLLNTHFSLFDHELWLGIKLTSKGFLFI